MPGRAPHPTRDAGGHSFNQMPAALAPFDPALWRSCDPYLYGIDLFNCGFYWEAHESLEAVWVAAGRRTEAGRFIQGLIQIAVAHLKEIQGFDATAKKMALKGIEKLGVRRRTYLGVDVCAFCALVRTHFCQDASTPVKINLDLAD